MADMTVLHEVINTMLPGDGSLGMPAASEAGVVRCFAERGLSALADEFIQLLEGVALNSYGQEFLSLDAVTRLRAINTCKRANVRLFSAFLTQVLRAYYTAPAVLRSIGAGSVPPFPSGNELAQDDWSMLEGVFERGRAYREVP